MTITPNPDYVAVAYQLAQHHHAGQVDKAGNPYLEHVVTVAKLCREHGPEAVAAGLLHDIVEDTDVTLDDLRASGMPETVVQAVDAVTRRPGETYQNFIARAASDPLGRFIKLADNETNSDPARLAKLDPEQADWFRRKYAAAREVLENGASR
jgi:(p)ppGpp synthase/HD superfamily hydrolase